MSLTDEQIKEAREALPKADERETVYVTVRGSTLRALLVAAEPDVVAALRSLLARHQLALDAWGDAFKEWPEWEAARAALKGKP